MRVRLLVAARLTVCLKGHQRRLMAIKCDQGGAHMAFVAVIDDGMKRKEKLVHKPIDFFSLEKLPPRKSGEIAASRLLSRNPSTHVRTQSTRNSCPLSVV